MSAGSSGGTSVSKGVRVFTVISVGAFFLLELANLIYNALKIYGPTGPDDSRPWADAVEPRIPWEIFWFVMIGVPAGIAIYAIWHEHWGALVKAAILATGVALCDIVAATRDERFAQVFAQHGHAGWISAAVGLFAGLCVVAHRYDVWK